MNALVTMTNGPAVSITSAEIADLVGKRHDNVKRTIEALIEQEIVVHPQIEDEPGTDALGRPRATQVYRFTGERGKRDSIVVVAQLSPEFTARLVDRWHELEQQTALAEFKLPKTMAEALRLAADQADRIEALEHKVSEDAPKVAALERFASHEGQHNVRNAAKLLGIRERLLITWLIAHDWMYRDHAGRLCAKSGRLADGCLDTAPVEIRRSDYTETVSQPRITQKGLTRLAVLLARDGLIPKEAA